MKRCIKIGAITGFLVGTIVFAGYALASWWVCSTLLGCPGHWFPYLIIFIIGVAIFTALGTLTAAFLRGMYDRFRVDG